jgi:hypothetical protein
MQRYSLPNSCKDVTKRACQEAFVSRVIGIQSDLHRQRWVARLAQGSEYNPRAIFLFSRQIFSRQIHASGRRFAQRSSWLLLERADELCSTVRRV